MAINTVDVPMSKLIGDNIKVTVRATGTGFAIWRFRLGAPLLWLGAKIAGVGFDVDITGRP